MSLSTKSKAAKSASSEYGYTEKQLREIFKTMDTNEDGGLGLYELKNALRRLDAQMPVHLAYKALCYADRNGDGNIGQDEIDKFIHYMMNEGYVV